MRTETACAATDTYGIGFEDKRIIDCNPPWALVIKRSFSNVICRMIFIIQKNYMEVSQMENTMISQRIRHYRRMAKLSQEDLAAKVDSSETYIRKLESGDRFPSLDMVMKLARALGTTPDHLLLSSSTLSQNKSSGVLDLLSDCTPTEFIILYENMVTLKKLLREHVK